MDEPVYKLDDLKIRIIGIPVLTLVIPTIVHFSDILKMDVSYRLYINSFLTTIILWEGNRYIIMRMRRIFPTYAQTGDRLVSQALLAIVYTFAATFVLDEILCKRLLHTTGIFIGFRTSFIPTLLVYLIYEAVFYFEAWKLNVRKSEALTREGISTQLEVLKNQLDPHFLFNSINTLAALIDDSNAHAQQYLERLSDVYRYVLVSRNMNTVTVEEEIAFMDAYIYLNKIRFRDNLLVEKKISDKTYRKHVTPLSLQMLIENAIKHNVLSKENPLKISIQDECDSFLVVVNNIQEKTIIEKSTKVGLQNIINRYSLLTNQRVVVDRTDNLFTVKIPLISQIV